MNSTTDTTISIPLSSEEELDLFDLSTLSPIPMVRQTTCAPLLRYENGILVDHYGNPTTPEEHQTTHAEILENIRAHRRLCNIEDDEEFLALINTYSDRFDEEELSELISPPALRRQYTMEGYLTYEDGVLIDHLGIPTTPEEHQTTHAEILINIFQTYRELFCYEYREDDFLEVLHKYVPESVELSPDEYYRLATPSPGGVITHYTDSHGNTHRRNTPINCGGVVTVKQDRYKIIGLNVSTINKHTYKTHPTSNQILHDETGKGITEQREFTEYTLYVAMENAYHAIRLSDFHCASSGGKLCSIGEINTSPCPFEEVMPNITHVPTLSTTIKFKLKDYYPDDVSVDVYNDPYTCVFKYSRDGNDERTPFGFVYVNMELFTAL